jgi:hypothetical protein
MNMFSAGPLRLFDHPLLGRPEADYRPRLWALVLGNGTLSCRAFDGPWKSRSNIRVSGIPQPSLFPELTFS